MNEISGRFSSNTRAHSNNSSNCLIASYAKKNRRYIGEYITWVESVGPWLALEIASTFYLSKDCWIQKCLHRLLPWQFLQISGKYQGQSLTILLKYFNNHTRCCIKFVLCGVEYHGWMSIIVNSDMMISSQFLLII